MTISSDSQTKQFGQTVEADSSIGSRKNNKEYKFMIYYDILMTSRIKKLKLSENEIVTVQHNQIY